MALSSRDADSAGHHLAIRVPVAQPGDPVATVIGRLGDHPLDAADAIYVVDEQGRFVGAVRLVDLLAAPPARSIDSLVDRDYPRVAARHDQEHAAAEALTRRATSVAVLDDQGVFSGAIPARALLEILRHEHVEDLHRLAGIQRENAHARGALEEPPTRQARHRLPWLLVGLAGSLLAAALMSRFEHVLERRMAIAFFVPTIVYLADAIGTQTEAVVVRGLSLSRLPLRRLLRDELGTGLLLGVALGGLAFPAVAVAFDVQLATAVATSIVLAGGVATSIGLLLPWLLQRAGSDPALGSGPVATIIQDVLSLLIYFAMATMLT